MAKLDVDHKQAVAPREGGDSPTAAANRRTIERMLEHVSVRGGEIRFDGEALTQKRFGTFRVIGVVKEEAVLPPGSPPELAYLAKAFYDTVYSQFPSLSLFYPPNTDRLRDWAFKQEIREAHTSRWTWMGNFEVVERQRGGFRVKAPFYDVFFVPDDSFEGPDVAGKGRIMQPTINETMQTEYTHLLGEECLPAGWPDVARFYWDVGPEGAIPLIRSLTGPLNREGVPFQFKILNHPRTMRRTDTAVLYVPAYLASRVGRLLPEIYEIVLPYLYPFTPPFAKRLGHGLAYSQDPHTGHSFGEHRCKLTALLIWEGTREGRVRTAELLPYIIDGLKAKGYPLERIHLNPETERDVDVALRPPLLPYHEFAVV